jgi:hypothetical protein
VFGRSFRNQNRSVLVAAYRDVFTGSAGRDASFTTGPAAAPDGAVVDYGSVRVVAGVVPD